MKEKHTRIGNMGITAAILAATSGLSYLLHRVSNSDFHVPMLFVLAVLFIYLCQRIDYQDQETGADPAGSGEGKDQS